MKRLLTIIAFLFIATISLGQNFLKMDKSVADIAYFPSDAALRVFKKNDSKRAAAQPKIRIIYARPLKKGREVFGKVVKFNEPWRIGANESTEILFMTDVIFGDKTIKAGRYTLIATPQKDSWTIHLNSDLDGWGNYSYDPSKDIASMIVPLQTSKKVIEALSIVMYEKSDNLVHIKIGWDHTIAEIPITLK